MHNIPVQEARALLMEPRRCEDSPGWMPEKAQPGTFSIGVGVVDYSGKSSGLYVDLLYQNSYKTKIIKYKFSLFRRMPYGLDRVYQLQVNHFPRLMHDAHQRSHEHIGDLRVTGGAGWENWRYDDVIRYFSQQINIVFDPDLQHPEHFELKKSP